MLSRYALTRGVRVAFNHKAHASIVQRRGVHYDGRNRLSTFWAPTQLPPGDSGESEHGHDLLVRAGFLRQAHSGIFHLLPLGLKVQTKIENLIDKHMQHLGASKVSLSSISSEELWQRSGRLDKGRTSELFQLQDRKGAKYLLSPTHEEEITNIISQAVRSHNDLPLRLYQVSRKYRDEPRPRHGLLRGREFIMKDLYTFDVTEQQARETYEDVRKAYVNFLEELRLPYLVAQADSGNMGGNLSHEYHFASSQGEDTIIQCDSCDQSINEELYLPSYNAETRESLRSSNSTVAVEHYVSKDRSQLCEVHYPDDGTGLNIYAVKQVFSAIDTSLSGEQAIKEFLGSRRDAVKLCDPRTPVDEAKAASAAGRSVLLTKAQDGDKCSNCSRGHLRLRQAVEIGHTFHLGTRYSVPLQAHVKDATDNQVPVSMGCHGIGVSRLIGAIAALLKDSKGLNWPLVISPFDLLVVPGYKTSPADVTEMYDRLSTQRHGQGSLDVAIDDRDKNMGFKLNDADLIGYPFIVVMGKTWGSKRAVELQSRRLGLKVEVSENDLMAAVQEYSKRL